MQVAMIPFFNHFGDIDTIRACECTSSMDLPDCEYFFFNIGVIYFPDLSAVLTDDDATDDDALVPEQTALLEFIDQYLEKPDQINEAVFTASKVDSFLGQWLFSDDYAANFSTIEARERMYEFCRMPSGNCSLITFSIFDLQADYSINEMYYQLDNGFCQDSFSINDMNQTALIKRPFATLVQDYKTCRFKPVYVALNQLGAALGWLDVLIPLAVILTILTIQSYKYCMHGHIPDTFSGDDKASVLDELALSLLLTKRHIEMMHKRDHPTHAEQDNDSEHGIELGKQVAPLTTTPDDEHHHHNLVRQSSFLSENPLCRKDALYQIVSTMLRDEDLYEDKYKMEKVLKGMTDDVDDQLLIKQRNLEKALHQ